MTNIQQVDSQSKEKTERSRRKRQKQARPSTTEVFHCEDEKEPPVVADAPVLLRKEGEDSQSDRASESRSIPPADSGSEKEKSKASTVKKDGGVKRNPVTTAALSRHRHPNSEMYPEVEYRIPKAREFTERKVKMLNYVHPCELAHLHSYSSSNEHPLCAAMRSIGEAYAINCAISTLRDFKINEGYILDVGGSGKRHISMSRKYMWSCIPDHSAKDKLRKFVTPPGQHCEHLWELCDCHKFPISISVHALYYIHPRSIFEKILDQTIPVHYALLHVYNEDKGELMDGEMSYVKNEGRIFVRAKGNIHEYVHDSMEWLKTGQMNFDDGTLVWERCRTFLDSEVIRFHAVRDVLPEPVKRFVVEAAPVESQELFDKASFDAVINLCIMPNKEINPNNREKFLESVRRKGAAQGLNVVELCSYADSYYLGQSTVLSEVGPTTQHTAYERKKRLQMLTPGFNLTLLLLGVITSLLAMIFVTYIVLYDGHKRHSPLEFLLPFTIIMVTLLAWIYRSYTLNEFDVSLPKMHLVRNNVLRLLKQHGWFGKDDGHLLSLYHSFANSWVVKAKVYDYCCQVPLKEKDPRKLLLLREPEEVKEQCDPAVAAYAMVYHPEYPPHFPRKCQHNVVNSVCNKLGQKIEGAGVYSLPLHPTLVDVAKEISTHIAPLSWEEWVSRFPSAKQNKLRREEERDRDDIIDCWNETSFFLKFEAYPEPKTARPICATRVELNYSLGRWLIPIAEAFSDSLPPNLKFPLHGDSVEIGNFHNSYKGYTVVDCDFSSFDSSQTAGALEIVFEFLELCGVPRSVVDRAREDKECCVLRNRKGLKVIMKALRFSGRSETLLGNSIITLNTALWILKDVVRALLVKGDDTVGYCIGLRADDIPRYVDEYLAQGLVAKLRVVDDINVEFCSSLFIPTDFTEVLTVKPGKLLAKTLWCKNLDYDHVAVEQQFASILKGLEKNIGTLPGIKGLYANPVYRRWFPSVVAHYDEYNEYASKTMEFDIEALEFMCERYDVTPSEIDELEKELSTNFPVRLQSRAARAMINKDWSEYSDPEHLVEIFPEHSGSSLTLFAVIEEVFRYFFPIFATLFLGCSETFLTGCVYHLIGHCILLVIQYYFGFLCGLVAHLLHNWFAGTKQLSLIMPNKQRKRNKKPAAKKSRPKKKNATPSVYAAMIADPCHAKLVNGIYGDASGLLGKYKTIYSPPTANTSGYVLWCPTGSSFTGGSNYISAVAFSDAAFGTQPLNTVATPYGVGALNTSGVTLSVGANPFATGAVCSDWRNISACIKATYIGSVSNCAGRMAFINGLPATTLLTGDAGGPMSTRALFAYSNALSRVSLDSSEVTYRPIPASAPLYKNNFDAPFVRQTSFPTALGNESNRFGDAFFGFAWDGIPGNQLSFEFIQNIEWRPEADTGYVGNPGYATSSDDILKKSIAYVDRVMPGWQTRAVHAAQSMMSQMANGVFTGAGLLGAFQMRGLAGGNRPLIQN